MMTGLLPTHRHIQSREDPGNEVASAMCTDTKMAENGARESRVMRSRVAYVIRMEIKNGSSNENK